MKKFQIRKRNTQTERPSIPDWIRDFRCQGWTNVFDRLPAENHLYGTETLFGNWNGRVLLLAKDWGPTCWLDDGIRAGEHRPWCHNPEMVTNKKLFRFAQMIPGEKLYGSATANMLLDIPGSSRKLRGFYDDPLQTFLRRVLEWVLESMPQVKWVACLGEEAWFLSCMTLQNSIAANQFKEHRDRQRPINGTVGEKHIRAFPLYHPAALGNAINEMETGWRAFAAAF